MSHRPSKFKGLKSFILAQFNRLSHAFEGKIRAEFSEKGSRRVKIWSRHAYTAVFCLMAVVLLVTPSPRTKAIPEFELGDIADQDVPSPIAAEIEPRETPKKQRLALEKKIAPIFDYDDALTETWIQTWEKAFQTIRAKYYSKPTVGKLPTVIESLQTDLESLTGQALPVPEVLYLHQNRFSVQNEKIFVELSKQLLGRLISSQDLFHSYYSTGIIVRSLNQNLTETLIQDVSRIWSIDYAKEFLTHLVTTVPNKKSEIYRRMARVVNTLLLPNLRYNASLTQKRIAYALGQIRTAPIAIRKGDWVVRRGDRVSDQQLEILDILRNQRSIQTQAIKGALLFVVLFSLLTLLFRRKISRKSFWNLSLKDAMFFMALTLLSLAAAKFLFPFLRQIFPPAQFRYGIEYLMPVAAGGIIIHLMMGKEAAYTFALILSVLLGILFDSSFTYTLWSFGVMGTAIETIRSCKQRTDLYKSGFLSGLAAGALALVFTLYEGFGFQRLDWFALMLTTGCAFASGLLSAILTNSFIPALESLFGYTTNLKLLELSNFNHPLLHTLMMKAPGTYHHSVIVGSLSEIAADNVKANGLLARVSAYYHDIGKMGKPLYFIENQSAGHNPHDHLAPTMSAKILFSHVKNGVRLGREHNLGNKITDIIEQHHGTTLVSYFFNKAKKTENIEMDEVQENDFRYPGPRPQSREAAIVMIADACEAATRSISDPTPAKIQTMVHNIINKRFLEEQFSDCDLTLNDLKVIGDCITRTLVSLYHNRIEYPNQRKELETGTVGNDSMKIQGGST